MENNEVKKINPEEEVQLTESEIIEQMQVRMDKLAVVAVAGRLLSKRGMGKVSFCDLHDRTGKIQTFTKIDALGEDAYKAWQKLDIGDIVGVEGEVFTTHSGEISIRTTSYVLLSKALRPLPSVWVLRLFI